MSVHAWNSSNDSTFGSDDCMHHVRAARLQSEVAPDQRGTIQGPVDGGGSNGGGGASRSGLLRVHTMGVMQPHAS